MCGVLSVKQNLNHNQPKEPDVNHSFTICLTIWWLPFWAQSPVAGCGAPGAGERSWGGRFRRNWRDAKIAAIVSQPYGHWMVGIQIGKFGATIALLTLLEMNWDCSEIPCMKLPLHLKDPPELGCGGRTALKVWWVHLSLKRSTSACAHTGIDTNEHMSSS